MTSQEPIKSFCSECFPLFTDLYRELSQAKKEAEEWKEWAERLADALNKIATSAPCVKGHESFNTPGQMCDQRIADGARSDFQKFKESKGK